jgi:hypothetical protein
MYKNNVIIRNKNRICILRTVDNERRQTVKLVNFWTFRFKHSNTGFQVYSNIDFVSLSRAPNVKIVISCFNSGQVISNFSNFLVSNFLQLANLRTILEQTNLEVNEHFHICSHHKKCTSYLHLFVKQ